MKKYIFLFIVLLVFGCNKSEQPIKVKKNVWGDTIPHHSKKTCSEEADFDKWVTLVTLDEFKVETLAQACFIPKNKDGTVVQIVFKEPNKTTQNNIIKDINSFVWKE